MKAAYWTAIGTMLIPLGIVILLEKPNMDMFAFWLIVAGFASFVAGWGYTIREERRNTIKEKEERKFRLAEEKRRRRESGAYLLMLSEIASKQGVNMGKTARTFKKWVDEEKIDEEEIADEL